MRKKILSATIAASVAALGVTGVASAAPAPTAVVQFTIMSTSATSPDESIILTGALTSGGTDISGNNVDLVRLPLGTFKIKHKGTATPKFDATTCLQTIRGSGTYKIVGGTGHLAGLTGSGKYKLSITSVAARTAAGKCSQKAAPIAYQFVVNAAGPVSLP